MLVRVIDARFTTNTFRMKSRGILQTCVDLGLQYIGGRLQSRPAYGRRVRQLSIYSPFPN